MALRDMFISIGYMINPEGLSEADARADAFRDNLLGAETQGQKLGATIAATGATAKSSMEEASEAASGLAGWWEENKKRVEGWGEQLKEYRVVLGAVAAITAGVVGTSVAVAADFEAAMSQVGAVSRASEEDMALLTKTARELGATTVFSASQAAEGMTFLAMAGFNTQQTIAAMPGLLDTAAAANEGLGRTADIVSNILSGFNLEAEQTGRIADVLTATFTSSNTTLGTLGETMKMVAPVAAALGLEIEDVAALTAVLGDSGIQGSMAGTALRTILTSLAAPTGAAAKAVENLGLQTVDAAGNMLPITSILEQISQATAHMGDAQRAAVLEMLAGREGVSALSALMAVGSTRIEEYADSLRDSAGVASEVAARQMDNLKGAVTEMRSAIEGAQITIGSAFIPVLRLGARMLTGVVSVFNNLPGPLQTIIAVGLGVVGVLSTMLLTASFLIPQIGAMVKGFTMLKAGLAIVGAVGGKAGLMLSAAWLPVTLAIAGVVAAAFVLQDVWMTIRGEGDTLTSRVIAWVGTWTDSFGGIVEWFRTLPERTMGALSTWWQGITSWFASTFDFGSILSNAFEGALNVIPAPLRGIAEKIMGFFPQSPAKEGPLSNLDRVGAGLIDELAGGIEEASRAELDAALGDVALSMVPGGDDQAGSSHFEGSGVAGGAIAPVFQLNVSVDARGSTADDAEQIGQTTADKVREMLDQWVRENFRSVVMQEV